VATAAPAPLAPVPLTLVPLTLVRPGLHRTSWRWVRGHRLGLCGYVGMPGGILPVPGQQRHSPDDQNRPARCLPRAHLPAPRCSSPPNRPFAYEDEDGTVMTPVVLNTL